ncbi:MAG: tetratricopeptide repeat protein [Gemmatimonadota bacterium]
MKNGAIIGSSVVLMLSVGFAWGAWQSVRGEAGVADGPLGQAVQTPHTDLGPVSGEYWARVDSLQTVLSERPEDNGARLVLARQLHDAHRVDEAAEHYREYLKRDTEDKQVYFDLAKAYSALGNWSEAARTMEDLLTRWPGEASAMYNLGAIEANRGRTIDALHWWERVRAEADDEHLVAQAGNALQRLAGDE